LVWHSQPDLTFGQAISCETRNLWAYYSKKLALRTGRCLDIWHEKRYDDSV
jgi:hypothetical protein